MKQSQSRTIRYAAAGFVVLALLLLIRWLALGESPAPSPELPPLKAVSISPHVPLFRPSNELHETYTDKVTDSVPIPTNAATIYRRAFALYDALSKDQQYLTGDWRTNVDPSVAAELCEKIQPICDLVRQAATATNCDWGLGPVTYNSPLPYLNPCRNLARAVAWSAARCRTNDPSAAVDDLVAASRLGQNVALTANLIGHLVNLAIQQMVINSAVMQAAKLADDSRLAQLFSDANYIEGLRHAIEQEADFSERTANAVPTMSSEDVTHLLANTWGHSSQPPSIEPIQVIADLRQLADLQREYAQTLDLPDTDYREWLASQEPVRKTNPFAEDFLSAIEAAASKTQAMTVMSAMAAAGLAVAQSGTDALPSHPDPITGQPFAYKQTPDGFELESSFQVAQKPLRLSFK